MIPAGVEPATCCLAYHYDFHRSRTSGIWGLDYIFTISGVARVVSTELPDNLQPSVYADPDYFSEYLPANWFIVNHLAPSILLSLLYFLCDEFSSYKLKKETENFLGITMPIHISEGFTDTASSTLLIHFSEQRLHYVKGSCYIQLSYETIISKNSGEGGIRTPGTE